MPSLKPKLIALASAITISFISIIFIPAAASAASPISVNKCNDGGDDNVGDIVDNNIGGRGITCDVTVINNLDVATGVTSSTVITTTCSGFANTALVCIEETSTTAELVSSVTQCNGTTNGGGGVLNCSVTITNNITGVDTPFTATVNQCVGSGEGSGAINTTICDPVESTTGAAITQCNGTGNGDGAPDRVLCNVHASTSSNLLPVLINQCNGSSNGGGAFATCDVVMVNNIITPEDEEGEGGGDGDGDGGSGGEGDGEGGSDDEGDGDGSGGSDGEGDGEGGSVTPPTDNSGGLDGGNGGVVTNNSGSGTDATPKAGQLAETGDDYIALSVLGSASLLFGFVLLLIRRNKAQAL